MNIVSHLLFGGVALSFLNFMIASVSMFNFFTKLDDMMKMNNFLMILLGWTMALLGGTNRVIRGEILVQGSLIVKA